MAEKVAHWITQSWDEVRLITPYAAAALVSGGTVSSVLVALVWLLEHHKPRQRRPVAR